MCQLLSANCKLRLSALPRSRDSLARFFVRRSPLLGFAFIPELLAFGEGDLAFYFAILEVEARRDERQSLHLHLPDKLPQLVFVDKQLARPQRRVSGVSCIVVRADVRVQQPELAVFDQAIGVFQVRASAADRLDLAAGQHHARFELLQQEIIMAGGTVERGIALARRDRIALGILRSVRLGLMGGLAGHGGVDAAAETCIVTQAESAAWKSGLSASGCYNRGFVSRLVSILQSHALCSVLQRRTSERRPSSYVQ